MKLINHLLRVWRWKTETRPVPPLLAGACVWAVLRFMPIEAVRAVHAALGVAIPVTITVGLVVLAVIAVSARRDRRTR